MRYLLALIPSQEQASTYIRASQQLFASLTDGYLLKEGFSMPHVTLCSFHCEEEHKLKGIYAHVQEGKIGSCPVRFLGLMLKKGKIPPHHYSVSLSVARDAPLLQLHDLAYKALRSFGISPLNPCQELYQPHLTLAGIAWTPSTIVSLPFLIDTLICEPLAPFKLVLGRGDDIGQYLETVSFKEGGKDL